MKKYGPAHLALMVMLAIGVGVTTASCEPEPQPPKKQCTRTNPCPPTVIR